MAKDAFHKLQRGRAEGEYRDRRQSIIHYRRQTKYSRDETNYDVIRHYAVPIAR